MLQVMRSIVLIKEQQQHSRSVRPNNNSSLYSGSSGFMLLPTLANSTCINKVPFCCTACARSQSQYKIWLRAHFDALDALFQGSPNGNRASAVQQTQSRDAPEELRCQLTYVAQNQVQPTEDPPVKKKGGSARTAMCADPRVKANRH